MKAKWIVMAFLVLVLTACDQDCNPSGPDVPVYVRGNGDYGRVYSITYPDETQPAQVTFKMEGYGNKTVNATEISEGNYVFVVDLLATYPNGAYYELLFFDWKVYRSDRVTAGRRITMNGYTFTNPVMSGEFEIVRCRLDAAGNVHEIF